MALACSDGSKHLPEHTQFMFLPTAINKHILTMKDNMGKMEKSVSRNILHIFLVLLRVNLGSEIEGSTQLCEQGSFQM